MNLRARLVVGMVSVALLLLTFPTSAQVPVVVPQSPGPDGSLVHVVRFGDTLNGILIAYANFGITNEILIERNNWRFLPQFIFPDEKIVILPPGSIDPNTGQLVANPPSVAPTGSDTTTGGDTTTPPEQIVEVVPPVASTGLRNLTAAEIEALAVVEAIQTFLPVLEPPAATPIPTQAPTEAATLAPTIEASISASPEPETPLPTEDAFAPVATEESNPSDFAPIATESLEGESGQPSATEETAIVPDEALSGANRDNRRFPDTTNATTNASLEAPAPTATEAIVVEITPTATAQEVAQVDPSATVATPEETIAAEVTPTAIPTEVAIVVDAAPTMALQGTLCLSLYNDGNQNAVRDADEERIIGGSFRVNTNSSQTQSSLEPLCLEGIAPGQLQVVAIAPPNYGLTSAGNVQVQMAAGRTMNIDFGAVQGLESAESNIPLANETLVAPVPALLQATQTETTTEESKELLDYAAYIVLALAVFVFGVGIAIAALWRILR